MFLFPTHFAIHDERFDSANMCLYDEYRYLAPEYAQSGQITEKADVYSFGVVLLELVTGRKAVDLTRPKGQQCLSEWVGLHFYVIMGRSNK